MTSKVPRWAPAPSPRTVPATPEGRVLASLAPGGSTAGDVAARVRAMTRQPFGARDAEAVLHGLRECGVVAFDIDESYFRYWRRVPTS